MSNKIFQLIHRLTPAEKRHYLKYTLSNSKEGKKSQHLIVFQTITKYNIQDNKQLQVYMKKETWFRNLARIKNYIYEDLVDYLVYHHRKRLNTETGYFSLLRNKVLQEKEFTQLACTNSKKAALEAEQQNQYFLASINFENAYQIHIQNSLFTPALLQESLAICKKIHLNIHYIKERHDYIQLNLQIMQIITNPNTSFVEKQQVFTQMQRNNPLLRYTLHLKNPLNYLSYADCLYRISGFLSDFKKIIQTIESCYQIVAQSDLPENAKPLHLYQFCIQLCGLYTIDQNKNSFIKIINLANQHLKNTAYSKSSKFLLRMKYSIYEKYMNFYFFNKEYELGVRMTTEITDFLLSNNTLLNDNEKIHLYFRLAVCHWGIQDYKRVSDLLESYLNFNKLPNYAEEYIALRLLYCIAQIDLGHYSLAKSQCRKLIYDKQKQPSWHELKIYKDFINKLYYLASILTEKKVTKQIGIKFQEIHSTINALSNDNQYKTLFQSWANKQFEKY